MNPIKPASLLAIWWLAGILSAEDLPEISVRLQSYVDVSSATLREASEIAGDILGNAGIRVVWAECSPSRNVSYLLASLRRTGHHSRTPHPDRGFANRDLREQLAVFTGQEPNQITQGKMTYGLRRPRGTA